MSMVFKHDLSHFHQMLIPSGKVVLAGAQNGNPYVWVIGDGGRGRYMRVFATGQEIPEGWTHVYSFQDSAYVWHVFEYPT